MMQNGRITSELWGRVRHRAEEVYEDRYFTRKVIGVGRLVAAWRMADKLRWVIRLQRIYNF